ncbi:hypothetical protein F2Q69_00013534 [Brassica cretica]|uniref:Uncharacterized protein n=1 Tax=Brassica cretica TaxID=69181 RepID=A0A8S9QKP1_BRACR|nr:hypothetical protein F2Q69_00013534 [Brassica cretica]
MPSRLDGSFVAVPCTHEMHPFLCLQALYQFFASMFASGLERSILSFHGSVVSMAAEVGSILALSKLRIGFQVRMPFVYLPHSRRQNVDPKIYTKYLIVFEI